MLSPKGNSIIAVADLDQRLTFFALVLTPGMGFHCRDHLNSHFRKHLPVTDTAVGGKKPIRLLYWNQKAFCSSGGSCISNQMSV